MVDVVELANDEEGPLVEEFDSLEEEAVVEVEFVDGEEDLVSEEFSWDVDLFILIRLFVVIKMRLRIGKVESKFVNNRSSS